jgi:hypothetical protein
MAEIELSTKGLDKLLKSLKADIVVKVGILQNEPRQSGKKSNATIGAAHEFGTSTLPQRSFLRAPISEHLEKRLQAAGLFKQSTINEIVRSGSMVEVFQKIGFIAEAIVADAFDTGGFGRWKPSDMSRKTNHQTLVETQQLRNSITSEVVVKSE